ncbi:hypothetical protein [Streptomyces sp. NRRL F-4707]|uniref:hypothetical protein n=1 Tax=Streptomyces sp. NRRL F-4707 TaxID=1519496 RepID=UPI00099D3A11|nr:hypothetical protein [Streptomyces sp. NRRL F-4707]
MTSSALHLGCMAENFDGVHLSATVTVSVLGAKNKQGLALSPTYAPSPRAYARSPHAAKATPGAR